MEYGLEIKSSEKTRSSGLDDLYITVKFRKFRQISLIPMDMHGAWISLLRLPLFKLKIINFKLTSKMHAEHTEVLQVITIGIVYKSDIDIKKVLVKEISSPKSLEKGSTTL